MRSSLLIASLVPLAFSAPVEIAKRDAASIVSAIQETQSRIATLNSTLNSFHEDSLDGIFKVLEIQLQTSDVGDSITDATSAANASQPLDSDDSNKVAVAVLALEPNIFSLLDNIQSKKPVFDTVILGIGSVSPQVHQDLVQQKQLSAELGNAITAKLASPYSDFAPLINGQIASAFDTAIATFATPGGLFALPAFPSFSDFKVALTSASKA